MGIVLLDTNIVSFIYKGDSRASGYVPHIRGQQLAISFMTVAELYQWAAIRKWGQQRHDRLTQDLKENYIILSFDYLLCQIWGQIRADRQAKGMPISSQDAWIAATALQHRLPLITHNPKDFAGIQELTILTTVN